MTILTASLSFARGMNSDLSRWAAQFNEMSRGIHGIFPRKTDPVNKMLSYRRETALQGAL